MSKANILALEFNPTSFPTFQDAYYTLNPKMPIQQLNIGGRLLPRSLVTSDSAAASLSNAIKSILDNNGVMAGISLSPTKMPSVPNSVHPYWRDTALLAFYGMYASLSCYRFIPLILVSPSIHDPSRV